MSDILAADYAGHDLAVVPATTGTFLELYILSNVQIVGVMIQIRSNVIDNLMSDRQNRVGPCLRQAFLAEKLLNERIFVRFVRGPAIKEMSLIFLPCTYY